MRIMLVDDEPKVLRGLAALLAKECPDMKIVGQFEDGCGALSKMAELMPNVVITDIKMPKMTGLELAAEAMDQCPDIQFLILSGYADFEYAQKALRFNVVDYFLKPPDYKKILARLREVEASKALKLPKTPDRPIKRRLVSDVCDYIRKHYYEDISLRSLSRVFFMNESYLSVLFKKETGDNFQNYVTEVRMNHAKVLLKDRDLKIYQIAEMVGYGSAQYFFRVFKQQFGVTPDEYREAAAE